MTNRKYFIGIILATIAAIVFVFLYMVHESTNIPPPVVETSHPIAPYKNFIFGTGIVEPSSENISIGAPLNRIVEKVFVNVGSKVNKGDSLLQLENRDLQSQLLAKKVALKRAKTQVAKLEAYPRPEDLSSSEAQYKTAEADYELARTQYEMILNLKDPRALSKDETNRRKANFEQAKSKLEQADAALAKVKSGTWKPDLQIAKLEALQALADLDSIKAEIDRTLVKAPIDGTILQVKTHPGEYALQDPRNPLIILGNTDKMHLRVSINQFDVPFFHPNASAVAFLQGDQTREFPLAFVRVEPYLVNKQNLTNEITEKVDTKVLQVIYSFKTNPLVFVGQQMDVFIESEQ